MCCLVKTHYVYIIITIAICKILHNILYVTLYILYTVYVFLSIMHVYTYIRMCIIDISDVTFFRIAGNHYVI